MSDTGYNHKYVYILGQGPVFDLFGYFIRRRLRCVNKWLNEYVSTDVEDRAQRVIRIAFMRIKLYRAMCLSCWPITPERFLHFAGGAEVGVNAAHVCKTPFYNRALCFLAVNDYSSNKMIGVYTRKKLVHYDPNATIYKSSDSWKSIKKRLLNNSLPALNIHSFAESAALLNVSKTNEYCISRAHDHIKYVSLRIQGGQTRNIYAYVDECPFIAHDIDDASEYLRMFVNLPTVEMVRSVLHYSIYNCSESKCVQFGSSLDGPIRRSLFNNSYANNAHKFIIEEYNDAGVLIRKKDYYRTVFFHGGHLYINDNKACALKDYLKNF